MQTLLGHPRKHLLFALLSLLDLGLTWWLLRDEATEVYESNPVANWLLTEHGWFGLAGFKAGVVVLVFTLVSVISRRRPQVGGRVLNFGCVTLAFVVGYSTFLVVTVTPDDVRGDLDSMAQAEGNETEINTRADRHQQFRSMMDHLSNELSADRLGLQEAVALVAKSGVGHDSVRLQQLAYMGYPHRTREETVAAHLIFWSVQSRRTTPEAARAIAERLEYEFRVVYGDPQLCHRQLLTDVWPVSTQSEAGGEERMH